MTGEPDIYQEDLMLAEVAGLDLVLARHIHQRALDTDDADGLANLTRAYARVTRSMRQNLALLAKQKADRAKAEREPRKAAVIDAEPEPDPHELAVVERVEDLHGAIGRISWRASGGDHDRHAATVQRFDRELDDWWDEPDFLDFDLDTVVRHAAKVLDLPADLAANWEGLPDPDYHPDPAPNAPRDPDRAMSWPPAPGADADDKAAPDGTFADSA